ncbi:MAG: hypothetical protein OEV92_11235 [Nitrospinota bacterium]|nr:hypothetical protein [Nitrospinota bacterium]
MEKQTAEVNLRLAQNNNEVSLLGEKVKRLEEAVNGLKDTIIRSSSFKPGYYPAAETLDFSQREDNARAVVSPVDVTRN